VETATKIVLYKILDITRPVIFLIVLICLKRFTFIRGHRDDLAFLGQLILQFNLEETGEHIKKYGPKVCIFIIRATPLLQEIDGVSLWEKFF
jgi:hypothetical protein